MTERRGRAKALCTEKLTLPALTRQEPHVFVCTKPAGHKGDHKFEPRT